MCHCIYAIEHHVYFFHYYDFLKSSFLSSTFWFRCLSLYKLFFIFCRFTCCTYNVYRLFGWVFSIQSIVWPQHCHGTFLKTILNISTLFSIPLVKIVSFAIHTLMRLMDSNLDFQSAAGGILGLVCGMLVETLLFIIRSSNHDNKSSATASKQKKNQ